MKNHILSTAIVALLSTTPFMRADEKTPVSPEAGKPLQLELKAVGGGTAGHGVIISNTNGGKDSGVIVTTGSGVLNLSGNAVPQSGTIVVTGGGATGQSKADSGAIVITGSAAVANPAGAVPQAGSLVAAGGVNGTATITIDVNGKKETRTFKLGEEPLKVSSGTLYLGTKPAVGAKETWIGLGLGGAVNEEVRAQLKLKPEEGVSVGAVMPDSPAAKAGLQQHDVLVRMDDQILISADQFKSLVKMHKPGETAKLVYFRQGERHEAQVTFAEREAQPEQHDVFRLLDHPEKLKSGKWMQRLDGAKDKLELLREKLKDAKDQNPGVIVESKAFVVGPDGKVVAIDGESKGELKITGEILKHLEKSGAINKEELAKTAEELRKALDAARGSAKIIGGEVKEELAKKIQEELEKAGLSKEGIESQLQSARKALEGASGSLKFVTGELKENLTKEIRERLEKSGLSKEELEAVKKALEGAADSLEETVVKSVQEALKGAATEEKSDGSKQ